MKQIPSIKKRLLVPILTLYIIMTIIIFSIASSQLLNNAIKDVERTIDSGLNATNQLIFNSINNVNFTCNTLSESDAVAELLKDYSKKDIMGQLNADTQLYNIIQNAWRENNEIERIRFFVEGKRYSSGSNAILDLNEIKGQKWFSNLNGTAMFLDFNAVNNIANESKLPTVTSISMYSKIQKDSEPLGYIRIDISKEYILSRLLSPVLYDDASQIFLVDIDGEVVTGNADADDNLKEIFTKLKTSAQSDKFDKKINGINYHVQYSELNNHGLRIVEFIPKNNLVASYKNIIYLFIPFALLFLLILTAFSLYIVNGISKRIHTYTTQLNQSELSIPYTELSPLMETVDKLQILKHRNNLLDLSLSAGRINPHFLYNTLDSIVWNLDDLSKEKTAHLLSSLGCFYRLLMKSSSFVCRLSDEIKLATLYMDLQRECFGSEFDYSVDIPRELTEKYVPSFILQPLIENSIIHGFKIKKHNLHINISAEIIDSKLIIILKDNGQGIDINMLNAINSGELSFHEGIRNVRQRIKLICGNEYNLVFQSKYTSETIVKIYLPIMNNDDEFNIKNNTK